MSVLLAVRNGIPYLAEAIDSVLDQSFDDFELLVIDDGSDDGTAALLAAVTDQRLRVLRNEANLGQVRSLNRGLREARGVYVARLDHDDVCRRDRLEQQVAVLDAVPSAAVVGSWATLIDADGNVVGRARQTIRNRVDFLFWNLVGWVLIPHPAATFRREVALSLGGYDESLGPSEDKDLWRRMALARFEARIVEAELIRYRVHTQQLSRLQIDRQRRHDGASHEKFLTALAGGIDARRARLLLTEDPAFFDRASSVGRSLSDLERLLHGACDRVQLDERERARLERLVRARVARAARRGWKGDVAAWRRASPPLLRYGVRQRGIAGARDASLYSAAFILAPLLAPARRRLRRTLRAALAGRALRSLEAPAARSALARRVYSWIIGG